MTQKPYASVLDGGRWRSAPWYRDETVIGALSIGPDGTSPALANAPERMDLFVPDAHIGAVLAMVQASDGYLGVDSQTGEPIARGDSAFAQRLLVNISWLDSEIDEVTDQPTTVMREMAGGELVYFNTGTRWMVLKHDRTAFTLRFENVCNIDMVMAAGR